MGKKMNDHGGIMRVAFEGTEGTELVGIKESRICVFP